MKTTFFSFKKFLRGQKDQWYVDTETNDDDDDVPLVPSPKGRVRDISLPTVHDNRIWKIFPHLSTTNLILINNIFFGFQRTDSSQTSWKRRTLVFDLR